MYIVAQAIIKARRERRKYERRWRLTGLATDRDRYTACCRQTHLLIKMAKKRYFSAKLETNGNKWKVINELLRCKSNPLPQSIDQSLLPDVFADSFEAKIKNHPRLAEKSFQ
jgi:hypothetical protein